MPEELFMTLLGVSVAASAVILSLKLTAGWFHKNYAAKWKYWIWLVLALRLVLPFHLSFSVSPVTVTIPNAPISANPVSLQQNANLPTLQTEADAAKLSTPFTQTNPLTLIDILMLIWVVGCVLFLTYQCIGYFIFRKRALRWSKEPTDAQTIHILHGIAADMGLKKEIPVLISKSVSSPLMTGFSKPLLFLPNECYSDTDLQFILRHELTHYKRHDLWYKLFLLIANAVHWFNPFIYLLFREASADLELSCDDKVINGFSREDRRRYSETILASITAQKSPKTALSTYFYGGQKTMKSRFANIFHLKKRNGAVALLAVILTVGIFGSFISCTVDRDENKLLTTLGYTEALVADILNNKTTADNEQIGQIVKSLPLPSYRKYVSFALQTAPSKELDIIYEINDNYNRGGNGLDPFYDTVEQNNALLLFASIEGLDKVNFLSYDNYDQQELNRTDSYTLADLVMRFGPINPSDMDVSALYNALGANIQLSEWYFAHYARIYLGDAPKQVSYRNGEPNEIKQLPDGSIVWIYSDFGKIYSTSPDSANIADPEHTAIYYFNSPTAEETDHLTGLYATRFIHGDHYGKTYDEMITILGYPSVTQAITGGDTYIAYSLAEGQQKNAYFIFHNNKVMEEGVMYGNDYPALSF